MKKLFSACQVALAVLAAALLIGACTSEADKANANLSKEAERFRVERRIVAINGITDSVLFTVQGYCSYEVPGDGTFEAICKVGPNKVERTTLYLSDNVTFVSTQLAPAEVSFYRPKVIFRPQSIVPDFDMATGDVSE